jgi:hypothetical protein
VKSNVEERVLTLGGRNKNYEMEVLGRKEEGERYSYENRMGMDEKNERE